MEGRSKKSWTEIKSQDSWSIFKYVGEITQGFDKLAAIGPCVSIFGSARTDRADIYYGLTEEIAYELAVCGYGIITGGGPGIMEAANEGAQRAKGTSVGLCIHLPKEQAINKYVDGDKALYFNYFFVRKLMFVRYAQAFVVMPGGIGTMDELFEALTLIQTEKIVQFPLILVGRSYWRGLLDFMRETMQGRGYIDEVDMTLFTLVDTCSEVVEIIEDFYERHPIALKF